MMNHTPQVLDAETLESVRSITGLSHWVRALHVDAAEAHVYGGAVGR